MVVKRSPKHTVVLGLGAGSCFDLQPFGTAFVDFFWAAATGAGPTWPVHS